MSTLYHNPGNKNHWIELTLEGVRTNRPAFGARICVTFHDGEVERRVYRTVGYGSSFGGNPWREHIGLGSAAVVDSIEVDWPTSHTRQNFSHVSEDRAYRITEGAAKIESVAYPGFSFQPAP